MRTEQFGWAGLKEEREAWEDAKVQDDFFAMSNANERLYREFSEAADELPALKTLHKDRPFTWDLERRLYKLGKLPYELIPSHFQLTGDCVAAGLAGTLQKLQVLEISIGRQEEVYREVFVPWLYGVSRNQIGKGKLRGKGSTGAWGARAINEYGALFTDDDGVPRYKDVCDSWGDRRNRGRIDNSQYAEYAPIAVDNKVAVVRATDPDQMVELLDAGYMLTIASGRGLKVTKYKGYHVYRKARKPWGHQMHITDIMRKPFTALYRRNQWGDSHAKPLNNESPGGAWNTLDDIEDEFRGGIEVYGYRNFAGSPDKANFNIV